MHDPGLSHGVGLPVDPPKRAQSVTPDVCVNTKSGLSEFVEATCEGKKGPTITPVLRVKEVKRRIVLMGTSGSYLALARSALSPQPAP